MCERELENEQNCNILTPTPIDTTEFLSRSPGLLNRGPGCPASLGAGFLYRILYPTDWTSCAPSYIIFQRPHSFCGRHKSHSFILSTVKVIFWYSLTGCTCYLHRCISYFDSLVGSEVNIQHLFFFLIWSAIHLMQISLKSGSSRYNKNNIYPLGDSFLLCCQISCWVSSLQFTAHSFYTLFSIYPNSISQHLFHFFICKLHTTTIEYLFNQKISH